MTTFHFYYFDSLFLNDKELHSERVFNNWIRFCKPYSDLKNIKWTNGSLSNYITQNDYYSFGLFVCYFFECLFYSNLKGCTEPFDLIAYREKINNTLCKLSLN